MKIEKVQPNIVQLQLHQEKEDTDYGTCLWANVVLDLNNYTIMIESDCGDYSYGWTPTPNTESFIKLLVRMDKEYFLSKISNLTRVDVAESIKKTLENLEMYEYDDANLIEEIKDLSDFSCSAESLYYKLDEILSEYRIHDSFEIIQIEKDYPAGAKKMSEIFESTIQPFLREKGN